MRRMPQIVAALAVLVFTSAFTRLDAHALCGDTVVDTGEDCDDGNTQAGDCCSATCAFEPSHFGCEHDTQGACFENLTGECEAGVCRPVLGCGYVAEYSVPSGVIVDLKDDGGERHLRWAVRGGRRHYTMGDHVPPGDPTVDTAYTFCIYEYDGGDSLNLLYENTVEPGADWNRTRAGWRYRKVSDAGPATMIRAQFLD